ncbi:MAG TPA: ricin-type beta-trefoil lectin domain protein [Chlamydiales bacterium]|nr:ricin-type beta-trefoil lectin domain protein [Chlamydiales bacterium]
MTVFNAANGSAALINDCSAGTQQRGFTFTQPPGTIGQIRVFNTFCLQANETNDGAKVSISSCVDGDARQEWLWNESGEVQWGQFLKMCLDLTDGNLSNGNQVCPPNSLANVVFFPEPFRGPNLDMRFCKHLRSES